ncbi:ATP-binding protein (plasmid) [Paraburkholderia acidicola]|uniref:histidine kinase n=1 Tax=Paraburkholderia acidicola TaxID=1912599 RepID=A0ABV1LYR2_9BURK
MPVSIKSDAAGRNWYADDYARLILFVGAGLLTVAMLVSWMLATSRQIDTYLNDQMQELGDQAGATERELTYIASRVDGVMRLYEMLLDEWHHPHYDNESTLPLIPPATAKLLRADDQSSTCPLEIYQFQPSAAISNEREHLPCSTPMLRNFWHRLATNPLVKPKAGSVRYLFGSAGGYLAELNGVRPKSDVDIDAHIDRLIQPIRQSLRTRSAEELKNGSGWWIPLRFDDAQRQLVLSYVRPIIHEDVVEAYYVRTMLQSDLGKNVLHDLESSSLMVVHDGQVFDWIISRPLDSTKQRQVVKEAEARRHDDKLVRRHRIGFTYYLTQASSDGTYTWVYSIPVWQTFLRDRWEYMGTLLSTVGLMAALWLMTLGFDLRILRPIAAQARQRREDAKFTRAVLDFLPFGCAVLDRRSGEVLLLNDMAQAFELGQPVAGNEWLQHIAARLSIDCESGQIPYRLPYDVVSGGSVTHFEIVARLARYMERDVLLCSIHDQTARVRTEQLLLEASQAKSAFLATMSHEIRTPLYGALGNLELLACQRLAPDQRELVDIIQQSFGSLLALINNVLDLSKIEANQWRSQSVTFDLGVLVERCIQAMLPVIRRRGLRVDYRIGDNLEELIGDEASLRHILLNLLHNAAKFTEHGSIVISADSIGLNEGRHLVKVEVADSGIGIAPDRRQQLFSPYVQIVDGKTTVTPGSGLGLALCKRFCELMGGTIQVEENWNGGSRFVVQIPFERGRPDTPFGNPEEVDARIVVRLERDDWPNDVLRWLKVQNRDVSASVDPWFAAATSGALALLVVDSQARAQKVLSDFPVSGTGMLVVADDGPLRPVLEASVWYVSAYSKEALLEACELATGRRVAALDESVVDEEPELYPAQEQILVVDDDAVSRMLIARQFAQLGFTRVDQVSDAEEAFSLANAKNYDLIVSDLGLGKTRGDALARRLKEAKIDAPIVLVTANIEWRTEVGMGESYFASTLVKPVSLDDIRHILGTILTPHHALPVDAAPLVLDPELLVVIRESLHADLVRGDETLADRDPQFTRVMHKIAGMLLFIGENSLGQAARAIELASVRGFDAQLTQTFAVFSVRAAAWLSSLPRSDHS